MPQLRKSKQQASSPDTHQSRPSATGDLEPQPGSSNGRPAGPTDHGWQQFQDLDADERLARQLAEEEEREYANSRLKSSEATQEQLINMATTKQDQHHLEEDEKLARLLAQEEEDNYFGIHDSQHTYNRQQAAQLKNTAKSKINSRREYNPINYSNVVIHTKSSKKMAKAIAKKLQFESITSNNDSDTSNSLAVMRQNAKPDLPRYPHVYDAMLDAKLTSTSINNQKIYLPVASARRSFIDYEEITVEKLDKVELVPEDKLVSIADNFDPLGQAAFKGCKSLNSMQSVVFETAYKTNRNMLVAAPTGAGKTNVAMMAVLNELRNWFTPNTTQMIDRNISEKFKIIYIAPMKSLATEQTDLFNTRLKSLGIKTRELTGDMSMTEREISQTHIIVTTPEKWDVVTRKSKGDMDLLSLVRLLIIDEVHLLQSDRGPVLEALVARTLRYVESSQKMTRIIGLSATLPNYIDVATFLCVNPYEGLFYFDNRFRPVPLTQTFIGVRPLDSNSQSRCMDKQCYNLAIQYALQNKQMMIFVHARNSTQRVATKMRELIHLNNKLDLFQPNLADFPDAARAVNTCKNKLLKDLFGIGFGVHHAGMVRQDRLLVERLFRIGYLKVLVCTSTLAWGVNFPAHAVVIRGTEIYDSSVGKFVDVGLLDVMQIFGRAGRPQYDTDGHAFIMTALDKIDSYLKLLTNQTPIESNFIKHLTDNLNAEIVSGTVSTVNEGMEWLRYTYLNVRLSQNPLVYGYDHYEIESDPSLATIRSQLIITAAKQLEEARMIRYNQDTGQLEATDLGLIASHFYINYATVMRYNELLNENMQPQDILGLIGEAQEFQQIKYREEEARELDDLRRRCYLPIAGGVVDTTEGKVSCLLQAYISRAYIETHSLISDLMYIAQNATRLARGLFEYSLKRGWPTTTYNLIKVCKMLELRTWEFHTPFRHFDLPPQVINCLEESKLPIETLETLSDNELGKLVCFPEKMGKTIKDHIKQLPYVIVEGEVKPVKSNLVKLMLTMRPYFEWSDRYHGKRRLNFWLWVVDEQITQQIYHSEHIKFDKEQVQKEVVQHLTINIPLVEDTLEDGTIGQRLPSEYVVFVLSDEWIGCDYEFPIDCCKITLPEERVAYTKIPTNLNQLPLTALRNETFASVFRPLELEKSALSATMNARDCDRKGAMHVEYFNTMQSQVFFTLYNRERNALICAPPGSGKTTLADIAALRVINLKGSLHSKNKIIYVAALDSLASMKYHDWKLRFETILRKQVTLFGDANDGSFDRAEIIVTSADKFLQWLRKDENKPQLHRVALVVMDDLHMINDKRGSSLDKIICDLNKLRATNKSWARFRLVALSNTVANPYDLAHWLSIKKAGTYNFHPATSRSIQLDIHIVGFPERHYSPRMSSMNKPIFNAILTQCSTDSVLIYVTSRKQCLITALDLISYLARHCQVQEKQWLLMDEANLGALNDRIQDEDLRHTLEFGIGLLYPSLKFHDKRTVEELYKYNKIKVLICTTNYAWESDLRGKLVVVKGTEHYDNDTGRFIDYQPADVMQMLGKAGRPNVDATGTAMLMIRDIFKEFYKKFLFEPFPIDTDSLAKNS